jgi:hypothetical protein
VSTLRSLCLCSLDSLDASIDVGTGSAQVQVQVQVQVRVEVSRLSGFNPSSSIFHSPAITEPPGS